VRYCLGDTGFGGATGNGDPNVVVFAEDAICDTIARRQRR